jgi:hypothetical protein
MRTDVEDKQDQLKFVKFNDLAENFPYKVFKMKIIDKKDEKEDFFRNQPIRNKNCLWWPCLSTDWDEISILYRGPSIDAPYHVSVHLAMRFQRRRFFRNRSIRNKNC